jgi:hypothetical protein
LQASAKTHFVKLYPAETGQKFRSSLNLHPDWLFCDILCSAK